MLQEAPTDPTQALPWIQDAVSSGRYLAHPHFVARCVERRVGMWQVKQAIAGAVRCSRYTDRRPTAGGTGWRVTGRTLDGDILTIGAEAFVDHLGRRALLVTVF